MTMPFKQQADYSNRNLTVDIAKGYSILLVAVYHSQLREQAVFLFESMGVFRLPLFFFVAGVFFNYHKPLNQFVSHKASALLKPYFVTLFLLFIAALLLGDDVSQWSLWGIFYGNGETLYWTPFWFLPHLFAIYLFSFVVCRLMDFDQRPLLLKWSVVISLFLVGLWVLPLFWMQPVHIGEYSFVIPGLPFSLDVVLLSTSFFLAGRILYPLIRQFKPYWLLILLAVISLVAVTLHSQALTDLNFRIFRDPGFALLGAASGIYLILSLSYWTQKSPLKHTLLITGQSTLFILLFHSFTRHLLNKLYYALNIDGTLLLPALFSFVCSVVVPILIRQFVVRTHWFEPLFLPNKKLRQAT